MDGYSNLAFAIVKRAIFDWRQIKVQIAFHDAGRITQRDFKRIESFLDSDWCRFLLQEVVDQETIWKQLTETKPARW